MLLKQPPSTGSLTRGTCVVEKLHQGLSGIIEIRSGENKRCPPQITVRIANMPLRRPSGVRPNNTRVADEHVSHHSLYGFAHILTTEELLEPSVLPNDV